MITYDEVKSQTTNEYFNGNQFSIDAFNKKYCLVEGETYVQALKRVCDYIASVEQTEELQKYWSNRWFDEIYNDWWHPAGSIMQGANSGKGISLANCTTVSLGLLDSYQEWDNLESIFKNAAYTVAKTAAYRQGLGIEFSRLRPAKVKIYNSAAESSGVIHWMKYIDNIGYFVGQKGRIPAMLFSLSCNHYDVEHFIQIKSDYTQIQNANISVQCTNDFYNAVLADKDWELSFTIPEIKIGDKVYIDTNSTCQDAQKDEHGYYYIARKNRPQEHISKTVKAKYLLELISENMLKNAEPGIQNIDIARYYSNSDYVYDPTDEYDSRIISTNACSEQYLSRESLCVLSSINCAKFSTNPDKYDKELSIIGESITRFLDNVNECEIRYGTYATPLQKIAIEKLRRIGAGCTNIAGWLFKNNETYDSDSGIQLISNFIQKYNYYLYKTSISLGKEKGSFGLFKREKYIQSPFVQRMLEQGLDFTHMRNVTCSSIAPTGTLSLMFRDCVLSYGIEPAFNIYFWKRTRISGKYEYYFCVPNIVRDMFKQAGYEIPIKSDMIKDTWDGKYGKPVADFIEKNKDLIGVKFKKASEVSALKKLELMSRVMQYIDSSISVTYLLPESTTPKDIYNFILEAYQKGVKSIAAYPDKQMYGIVSFEPFKDLAVRLINSGIEIHKQNFDNEELKQLSLQPVVTTINNARPREVPCDVHHASIKGHQYFILVGKVNDQPFEVFAGKNGFIPKEVKTGKIIKKKQGFYKAVFDGTDIELAPITAVMEETEEIIARLTSALLRSGADMNLILSQLEKVGERQEINSYARGISRILKKYVKDNVKVSGQCPQCGSDLVRLEGCKSCTNASCNWQACL